MTDERDPRLSRRYRELGAQEPSRELDQAILAAAHRSVDKPHAPLLAPAGRHRWYYSLAAAAVLVLSIAVTLHIERQQPDAELAVPPAAAPAPAPAPQLETRARDQDRPAYAPEPAPAPAPMTAQEAEKKPAETAAADTAKAAQQAPAAESRGARSRAAPAPSSSAPMAARNAAITPQGELERIAELRRQGRDDEADKALAEFRKRYPDYQISAQMREKVERKPAR